MKTKLKTIILALLAAFATLPANAQQEQGDKRTKIIFAFPEFREAKVIQPFGRYTTAKVNILLKNSTLCFVDGENIKEAYVQNVLGVTIDSLQYVKINDRQMARVVAQKGYNQLLCLTTIDEKKLTAETFGGDNLPYLEIPDTGFFYEVDGQRYSFDLGYPLKDQYFFSIKGQIVPANESKFKAYVRPDMKQAFKHLMADKWWSWKDPASLAQLFTYLPE